MVKYIDISIAYYILNQNLHFQENIFSRVVNGECIGAYVSSLTFANTLSLDNCGPTLLDHTNGTTFISHPMIGAMRLTEV